MLNDLLGVTNAINVLWTLSYEMVFYLLLTALFTVGVHRRSGRLAFAFAAAALLLGGVLPTVWLSQTSLGPDRVALAADLLVIGGLALAVAGRRLSRTLAAGFLAVLLGLSSVTYYLVEAPMQRAGRGLARRLDARFGPDRLTPAGARGS